MSKRLVAIAFKSSGPLYLLRLNGRVGAVPTTDGFLHIICLVHALLATC